MAKINKKKKAWEIQMLMFQKPALGACDIIGILKSKQAYVYPALFISFSFICYMDRGCPGITRPDADSSTKVNFFFFFMYNLEYFFRWCCTYLFSYQRGNIYIFLNFTLIISWRDWRCIRFILNCTYQKNTFFFYLLPHQSYSIICFAVMFMFFAHI